MSNTPELLAALDRALASQGSAVSPLDHAPMPAAAAPVWGEGELPLGALALELQGLGALPCPLNAADAQALHALCQPAPYGRGEQTLVDAAVRDTGELSADAVSLAWAPGAFAALESAAAQALGLPAVQASLHALLVYGPGQFFKPHQDTEKVPGMVATLVLLWPSAHLGGTLRIRHLDTAWDWRSQHLQAPALRWVAFFADCQHEVLPVEEGWRVALTFDLALPAEARSAAPVADPGLVQALRQCFADPLAPRTRPWLLLLDHQYTAAGLRWPLLKGADRSRVAMLRAAAEACGLVMHLALVEIHQTWDAHEAPRRSRHGSERIELGELIDEDVTLDHWVDAEGNGCASSLSVSRSDIDSYLPNDEDFLVDEEYEGYMGNWGQTMDQWYRRAALVLQSPLAAEATRFDTEFDAALADALALARQPGQAQALALRLASAPDALRQTLQRDGRLRFAAYAELAAALPDPAAAAALLAPLHPHRLEAEDAPALARLARRWGEPWVVAWWMGDAKAHRAASEALAWGASGATATQPAPWPMPLAAWAQAMREAGLGDALLQALFNEALASLLRHDQLLQYRYGPGLASTLADRLAVVADLARAMRSIVPAEGAGSTGGQGRGAWPAVSGLLAHVAAQPALYPVLALRPLLQALGPRHRLPAAGQRLWDAAVDALRTALGRSEPGDDDFSLLSPDWACVCADCATVRAWLHSPRSAPFELAAAEARRKHVTEALRHAGMPVATETIRKGSPHRLRLGKPQDTPQRSRMLRQAWVADLAALAQPSDAGTTAPPSRP